MSCPVLTGGRLSVCLPVFGNSMPRGTGEAALTGFVKDSTGREEGDVHLWGRGV